MIFPPLSPKNQKNATLQHEFPQPNLATQNQQTTNQTPQIKKRETAPKSHALRLFWGASPTIILLQSRQVIPLQNIFLRKYRQVKSATQRLKRLPSAHSTGRLDFLTDFVKPPSLAVYHLL